MEDESWKGAWIHEWEKMRERKGRAGRVQQRGTAEKIVGGWSIHGGQTVKENGGKDGEAEKETQWSAPKGHGFGKPAIAKRVVFGGN